MKKAVILGILVVAVLIAGCTSGGAGVSTGISNNDVSSISSDIGNIGNALNDTTNMNDINISDVQNAFS